MNAAAPPPIVNPFFDLSLLPNSDGTGRQPIRGAYFLVAGQNPRAGRYLRELSRKYRLAHGGNLQFTSLPHGYTLWWKAKAGQFTQNGTPVGAFYVYGNRRGPFRSVDSFIVHLHNMINFVPCRCIKCR